MKLRATGQSRPQCRHACSVIPDARFLPFSTFSCLSGHARIHPGAMHEPARHDFGCAANEPVSGEDTYRRGMPMRPGRLRLQPRSLCGSLMVAIALTLPAVGTAIAQDATPVSQASPFSPPAGCTVYADGLLNPRYMTFDRSGNLYVSEAGDGGSEAIMAPASQATPGAGDATPQAGGEAVSMYGTTGRVTKIAPDGTRSVVASDLPSYTFGSEIVGPAGIAFDRGTIYLAIGGPGPATALVPETYLQNSVVAIDPSNGDIKTIADIGAYERSNNPDPNSVDSNLYGLAAAGGGILYVADAGGNTVYRIDSSNGDFKPLAVIPGVPMEGMKNPNRGGKAEIDPVPTDVIPAPGGGVYVGELTGGPFPQGAASILKINDNGSIETTASGLTMSLFGPRRKWSDLRRSAFRTSWPSHLHRAP